MRLHALVAVALAGGAVHAQPADWGVRRDPFDPLIVARYEQVLAKAPHDTRSFGQLVALYRRYRTLDQLDRAYAEKNDWASLVVRAQLHALTGAGDVIALLERAVAANPRDAEAWLELAKRYRATKRDPEAHDARDAYEHVAALAPAKAGLALRALIELAPGSADPYYARLIALEPNNGNVWLDRGDAQLAAKATDAAAASYQTAEQLLAGDPARRVDAVARRGHALEPGDARGAEAEYLRAIAMAPHGYFLVADLVGRIVEIHRRAHTLPELAAQLEQRWPVRTRDHLAWSTLGELYRATGDLHRAIGALDRAAKLAPWELATARSLIALYDEAGSPDAALARLEAAARAAPGEPSIQLELAERLWPVQRDRAIGLLHAAEGRFADDVSVLTAVAERYGRWDRPALAHGVLERIARLEPDEEEHWIALADSYLGARDPKGAVAAWKRVAREQPVAIGRFAELLIGAGAHEEAIVMIDHAIELDHLNPELWRLRAWAHDAVDDWEVALSDAEHQLALTSPDRDARRIARHNIVQILIRARHHSGEQVVDDSDFEVYRARWYKAFAKTPPDLDAGYLLLDLSQIEGSACTIYEQCEDLLPILERLVRFAPDDVEVLQPLVRTYRGLERFDDALRSLRELARVSPAARARDIAKQAANVELERKIHARQLAWIDGGDEHDIVATDNHIADLETVDPKDLSVRIGARLGIGGDLHGTSGRAVAVGLAGAFRVGSKVSLVTRIDLGQSATTSNASAGVGMAARIATSPGWSLAVGAGERAALRFGDHMDQARTGLAGELSIDLTARHLPFGVGARLDQGLAGGTDTTAVLELAIDLR